MFLALVVEKWIFFFRRRYLKLTWKTIDLRCFQMTLKHMVHGERHPSCNRRLASCLALTGMHYYLNGVISHRSLTKDARKCFDNNNFKVMSMSSILIVVFDACKGMSSKYDYKLMWFQFNRDLVFITLFWHRSDHPGKALWPWTFITSCVYIYSVSVFWFLSTGNGVHKFTRFYQVSSIQNEVNINFISNLYLPRFWLANPKLTDINIISICLGSIWDNNLL